MVAVTANADTLCITIIDSQHDGVPSLQLIGFWQTDF
jgi:hypothetical protein